MKKNYAICILMISSLFFFKSFDILHAQEKINEEPPQSERETPGEDQKTADGTDFILQGENKEGNVSEDVLPKLFSGRLVFTFGAAGILNTDKNSAPSPVLFSVGAGTQFPFYENPTMSISAALHAHFFASFYFWDKTRSSAFPAETEQRTAYVPSILFDSPILFYFPVRNSVFTTGLGPSFLIRFAARAINVSSSENDGISLMNKWFWQNARFFYPSLHFSWDYIFPSGAAAGIGLKAYISTGGLVDNRGLDRSMVILSARLMPAQRR